MRGSALPEPESGISRRRARRTNQGGRRGRRLSVAIGATAAVAVGATSPLWAHAADAPQATCHSQNKRLADRLSHDIDDAVDGRDGTQAVSLYDRHTGTSCQLQGHKKYDSASVVKATLLGSLLRKAEEAHRTLTPHEKKAATAMITRSDNDATTKLWHEVGARGVRHFLDLAGMHDTVPGKKGTWGLTQVTAADQAKLLKLLTSHNSVLGDSSRAYELGLMNKVEPGQRWGSPHGAPPTAVTHVKNGWLERDTGGWRVHSVGAFTGERDDGGGSPDYGLAVLTDGNEKMKDGVHSTENVAKVVHRDLARAR